MKYFLSLISLLTVAVFATAQDKDEKSKPEYQFTTVRENPIGSIKNQYRSGTCWCFSTISFLESEILRTQKKATDLSAMWIVSHSFSDRGTKYVRMDGHMGFADGSGFGDAIEVVRKYGIVPNSIYTGMQYGSDLPQQKELTSVLTGYLKAIVATPARGDRPIFLSTAWKKGFDAVIQAYMGEWVKEFDVDGVKYTPESYRDKCLKLNVDDYVNICSFISDPLYKKVPIEVCDNWRNCDGWNVSLADMMNIIYNALDNGYCVAWGGDVSEKGFTRNGIGVLLKEVKKDTKGSDQEHWVGKEKKGEEPDATLPEEISEVTDAMRQDWYDRKYTTDDHGMLLYGTATDQNGTKYFKVQNSWGTDNKYQGTWYMSEKFIAAKTLNIVVHKNAIPKDIRKKLGL